MVSLKMYACSAKVARPHPGCADGEGLRANADVQF